MEQRETHKKTGVNSSAPGGRAVPASLVKPQLGRPIRI